MGLTALLVPIVLSAVIVFVASSIIHMGPFWHKNDFPMLAGQDKVMDALRPLNIPPGEYMIPRPAAMADMKAPEFQEKMKKGPVLMLNMLHPGPISMGAPLAQWFGFCLLVSVFAAYLASRTQPATATYLAVHRVAGCSAFMGYALAAIPNSIWYKRSWTVTAKTLFDGLIFGMLTGGTFGWWWVRGH
jgi:hypothetical protein